ncbi:FAD binding domain-containing protein [Kibdelosporangium philippinense]|uniref:FAD binding domain-containing protein n=1 Tax=Kibdelosporangium philippinense TaxID=211113 RepID=A0ABS8ZL78_9PSEU|nr:FAD binding domain-containing protein [Kibdelosporangium philippinense]MCE7006552.1 FAD binding domain-containing protein [Kibdelosporangium philippinense]
MKPARFDYVAPARVADAVAALAAKAETARVLAGGQTLVSQMHFRTERPALVVDINNIKSLETIAVQGGALRVGALARHRAFETPSVAPGALGRLLSRVSPLIANPPVRALGTMGGSLAWASPQAEWCATAAALDAEIELTGPAGRRMVTADKYFLAPSRTARRPDELLTSVRLPLLPGPGVAADKVGVGFVKHHRTNLRFAQAGVVAVLALRNGAISSARLGVTGGARRRPRTAEAHLIGREPVPAVFTKAGELAAAEVDPYDEVHASAEYKRHAIGVLVRRALVQACADMGVHHSERETR